MLKICKKIFTNFEKYSMIVLLCVFLINIFFQIITRLVGSPLSFTEEVSRYAFVWMVFLGLSYATKYDKHIRVDVFISKAPKNIQFWVEMLINLITLIVFLWVFWNGLRYVEYSSISKTYALNINKGIVVLILPLSGLLMIIRVIEKWIRDIKNHKQLALVKEDEK